jgi:hypothetical protein
VIQFLFLFFDFLMYSLFNQPVGSFLLAYLIFCYMSKSRLSLYDCMTIFLLLVEDFFMYNRFGHNLLSLLIMLIFGRFLLILVHQQWRIASGYLLILVYGCLESTILQIFVTIVLETFILLGTRGNRFLPFLRIGRGKSGLQTGRMPYEDRY